MGVFKVLGGVAAFAIGGPIVGTAYVAGMSAHEGMTKKAQQSGYDKGYAEARAEDTLKMQRMEEMVREAQEALNNQKAFETYVISMYAVALSAAHCNNRFDDDQKEYIEEFLVGRTKAGIHGDLLKSIGELYYNPPSFNTAMEYVKKVDRKLWCIYDEIIDEIINVDGYVDSEEGAFQDAWNIFKAA